MTALKSVLVVAVCAILVSCNQEAGKVDDGHHEASIRVVRQSEVAAENHPAVVQENAMDVAGDKDQILIKRLKGQEEVELSNEENNDGIEKINRFRRSPKGKKGGGVAKGGGGGCKKGRK